MMSYARSYDRWVGLILLIVAAGLFIDTFTFKTRPFVPLNTAFWPRVILFLMAVVSAVLILRGRLTDEAPEIFSGKAGLVLLGAIIYVIALPLGGFFAMSALVGATGYFWLSETRTLRALIVAVIYGLCTGGGVYLLFQKVLLVQLPDAGIL